MPIIFPSFDITGIRPSRWYAAPLDYPKITQSFEFEDGGKGFNEVADNAPRHWEYGHTGLSFADAQQFDDFYNLVRLSQPFDFKDKYGATWHNVYVESYTRNHDAHKSWSITVTFHLVNYDGTFTPAPMVPAVPTGLRLTVLSDSSILAEWDAPPDTTAPTVPVMSSASVISDTEIDFSWTAATDDVGVTGYDLEVATNAGFTTGLVTHNLGNVLTYHSTGLTASTTYYARVRAHDAVPNNSAYSSSVNATTNTPTTSKWQTPPPTDWVLNGDYSREATAATFASATNIVAPRIAAIGDYIEVMVVSIGSSGGGVGGWFAEDSLGKLITISSSGVMSSTDVGDQYLTTGWTVGDTLRIEKTGATQLTITKVGVEFQVMNQIMTGNVEIRWGGLTATGVKLANPVTNI